MRTWRIPAMMGILAVGTVQGFAQDTRASHAAPGRARTVVVPAHVEWTNALLRVERGQLLRFEPSGEIRLSLDVNDVAVAAGARSGRKTDKAPIPSMPAGTLIGRVNNGRPFSIGNTTEALTMPAGGMLYLMVNDDEVGDNSGNLVVRIWKP